ncbi:MAG: histidine phosphatase family protein [Puniceicoccales bacterium]|jgi:phosphohistidine phosphatase|nr:histidine phosphatase family protein [Puniceicoccales bacterium]
MTNDFFQPKPCNLSAIDDEGNTSLFLLRHGLAEDPSPTVSDAERRLTPAGIAQVKEVAAKLDFRNFARLAHITHSPLARARETAALFRDASGLSLPLEVCDSVQPNSDPRKSAAHFATAAGDHLIVGHNPHIEQLVCLLLGQGRIGVQACLPPAACIALERFSPPAARRPYGYWRLHWLVIPLPHEI